MKIFLNSLLDSYQSWKYYLHLGPFLILAAVYFVVTFVYLPECAYYDSVKNVLHLIALLFFGGVSFLLSFFQLLVSLIKKQIFLLVVAFLLLLVVGMIFYFIVGHEVFMLGECISERVKIYPAP